MSSSLFSRFIRHPGQVGAFCASSRYLSRAMVVGGGVENSSVVVELGPGTGVITREILSLLPETSTLVAVELDQPLADQIEKNFPRAIVCRGCASKLGEMLAARDLPRPGAIISGLPWAIFPEELQDRILRSIVETLAPGGCFSTFAYLQGMMLPAGVRFRRRLTELFTNVESNELVFRNLPPALIYRCRN